MPEQSKTLLQFDGDASGARAAAEQAKAAIQSEVAALQQLSEAEQAAAAAAQRRSNLVGRNKPIDMLGGQAAAQAISSAQEQADALRALADEAGGVQVEAQKMGTGVYEATATAGKGIKDARQQAIVLAEVLTKIDPTLGSLTTTALHLGDAFKGAFGVSIAQAAAMAGSIAVIVASVDSIITSIQEAYKRAKEVTEEIDRANEKQREKRAGVAEQLALHGVGDAGGRNAGQYYQKQLEQAGIDEQTAAVTAAAVVAARKGGVQMTTDQMIDLANLQKSGGAQLTKGINAESTAKNVRDTLSKLEKLSPQEQASLRAGAEQRSRNRKDVFDEIASGNETTAKKYLVEEQNFSEAKASAQAANLVAMLQGESPSFKANVLGHQVPLIPGSPGWNAQKSDADRMVGQFNRDRSAAEAAVSEASSRNMTDALPAGSARKRDESWSEAMGVNGKASPTEPSLIPTPAFDPDRQNKPTIINNYSGTTFVNVPDPRTQSRPRMTK
jgi:hypothetical protein